MKGYRLLSLILGVVVALCLLQISFMRRSQDIGVGVRLKTCQENEKLYEAAMEQSRRKQHISTVCKRYRGRKFKGKYRRGAKRKSNTTYVAVDELYDQTLGKSSFLLDAEKTRSAYCFNHKAASTTWMSIFARLEGDEDFLEEMRRTQQYYKVHGRMGPRTNLEVLNWATGNNEDEAELFFFTVVRNPFDRILSTYRDRILKVCSQSIVDPIIGFFRGSERDLANAPEIPKHCNVSTAAHLPSFNEFLTYLGSGKNYLMNAHWTPFGWNCAPCVVEYDAIVKLETEDGSDEAYVIRHTGIDMFTELEQMHVTGGGSAATHRFEFFSQVDCEVLRRVYEIYKMDFDLFEYDAAPFFELCSA